MGFLKLYELVILLGVVVLLILVIAGALLIYSGKSRINRKNIFILVIYRLIQLLFGFNVIVLVLLLLSQIFSIKFYSTNSQTGGQSYGWLNQAEGYEIPMRVHYDMPKQIVNIRAKVGNEVQTISRKSSFSWINNPSKRHYDSLQSISMPLIFGKDHVPYLGVDTVWNKISIDLPAGPQRSIPDLPGDQRQTAVVHAHPSAKNNSHIHLVPTDGLHEEVFVRSGSPGENFVFALFTYLKLFAWMAALFFLAKILSSFRRGQLFAQKHFAYVSYIGIALVSYQILRFILAFICNEWIMTGVSIYGTSNIPNYVPNISVSMHIDYNINFPLLITGFLIVIVAQVFREGFVLQKEQALTI